MSGVVIWLLERYVSAVYMVYVKTCFSISISYLHKITWIFEFNFKAGKDED